MSTRLGDLVESLGGELIGDPDISITGIAPLDAAGASHITFLSNPRLRASAAKTQAAALILPAKEHAAFRSSYRGACILTDNPYAYYARVAQFFCARNTVPPIPGVHPSAVVDSSATIAASAFIGPNVTIEAHAVIGEHCLIGAGCVIGMGASIGEASVLHPNVSFLAGCHIGARGVIQSGAVIGGDGFGFANDKGRWIKIPQTGGVRIGDDVEIGANTTIDRGALDDTVIGNGVKLDNQIQIAHNCVIGENTAMAGCVGVAGSATIGAYCTVGGGAVVLGHLKIADHVNISASTTVMRSISEPGLYTGVFPIDDNANWEKNAVTLRQLAKLRDRIRALEQQLKN